MNRSNGEMYSQDDLYNFNELFILILGFCYLIIGMVSVLNEIPEEFAVGATLAAFFFVLAESFATEDIFERKIYILSVSCMVLAIFCLVLLPVLLLTFGTVEEWFSNPHVYTFLGFGLVLISFGAKSINNKNKKS